MSSSSCESDDAPEEYTSQQGLEQQIEINRARQQSIAEARLQVKERRKKWAQRLTPKSKPLPSPSDSDIVLDQHNNNNNNHSKHSQFITGMLPDDIVTFLARQNNQVFLSDSDEDNKPKSNKKRKKKKPNVSLSGIQTVILKELPPTNCVNNSLEFLNKRKMQVPRSSAVLNNSNQALRLLSSSGLLN